MAQINQLPLLSGATTGDQIPVYSPSNGDARRLSLGSLLSFFQQQFASPTLSVSPYVPATGANLAVPSPVSNQQWMLIQPTGTLATLTVTLPLNTSTPDGTEVLITSTQAVTTLTIGLNGASAVSGDSLASLVAGGHVRLRFYQPYNTWYRIA